MADDTIGRAGARNFLKRAIDAKRIQDELEAFGTDELQKVVDIAKSLGYDFRADELEAELKEGWTADEMFYVKYFCLSEPPAI